jgi:Flp pilus assembly protein TadD
MSPRIWLRSGQFSLAEDLLRRALEIRPKSPGLLTYLGIVLYEQGDYLQSRQQLMKALNLNSNNSLAKQYIIKAQQGMYSNE